MRVAIRRLAPWYGRCQQPPPVLGTPQAVRVVHHLHGWLCLLQSHLLNVTLSLGPSGLFKFTGRWCGIPQDYRPLRVRQSSCRGLRDVAAGQPLLPCVLRTDLSPQPALQAPACLLLSMHKTASFSTSRCTCVHWRRGPQWVPPQSSRSHPPPKLCRGRLCRRHERTTAKFFTPQWRWRCCFGFFQRVFLWRDVVDQIF